MTLQEIRARLQGAKGDEHQFTARCPAHDDRANSLSVGISGDGERVLLHCHAGCGTEQIATALGIKLSDLFATQDAPKNHAATKLTYEYRDADGSLLYTKTRVDKADGTKTFYFTQPDGTKGVKGVRRVPYNLPAVMAAQTVYFVEGEKCADAVNEAGRTATTLDGGANSRWLPEYAQYFTDKTVIIIPDNDAPGIKYAQRIAANLPGSRIVELPGVPAKADVFDWLRAGHTMGELDTLQTAPPPEPTPEKEPRVTQAETLLKLVENTGADYFHSDMNDLYATIPVAQHTEVWALDGRDFATWLHGLYYREIGKPVNNEAVGQAVSVLSARARFDRPEPIRLSTRVAEHNGAIWYDLTNSAWQAVEVSPKGWKIHDNPPILFNRYRHQAAQVMPQPGGDIRKVLNYVNVKSSHTLFLCWLVSSFIPEIPHPMPIFYGEKGSGKSTASGQVKKIVDPSALDTMTLQNDPRALAVNLQQHWLLPFDNVSYINEETSDTLCRAITGSGIQQRKLFTNSEDTIFTFKRCLAINGINNVATRSDLLDRSLLIELERIPEDERRELADIESAFERDRPAILGGIFDTLVQAMKIYPTIKLDRLPRMADFARWGYAIGEALCGAGQTFLDEYAANRDSQNTEVINADPVATLVVEFMRNRDEWNGKVSELYGKLTDIAASHNISTRSKSFPTDPARLAKRMNGIKSNLEAIGLSFEKGRNGNGATVSLQRRNLHTLPTLPTQTQQLQGFAPCRYDVGNVGNENTYILPTRPEPLRRNGYVSSVGNVGKNSMYRGRI